MPGNVLLPMYPSFMCGVTVLFCHADVDECTEGTHNCSVNATCTNTVGGFTCECLDGFTGDGVSCNGKD